MLYYHSKKFKKNAKVFCEPRLSTATIEKSRFRPHSVAASDLLCVICVCLSDDCISPGYHATLPVEVHGACYCDMQMISKSSYQTLKCPVVVITQHTFDLEALTYHITNHLCSLNNKQYGFFYDWAFEPINVSD